MDEALKDGAIYFWQWKNYEERGVAPYWCQSQKAIVEDGRLIDTYWHSGNNTILDLNQVDAEYQGNINEMSVVQKYDAHYYKSDDLVDMRHPNDPSGVIYLKPDSTKDVKTMRRYLNDKSNDARNAINSALSTLEYTQRNLTLLEIGKVDEVYL